MTELTKFTVKNFKQITNLEINFNGESIFLIGANGAGKTSFIDGIIILFRGKNALPKNESRFQMIQDNADKSVFKGTLKNDSREIVITRTITKKDVKLKIESSDGENLGQAYLDKIFNEFCLNPMEKEFIGILKNQLKNKTQILLNG